METKVKEIKNNYIEWIKTHPIANVNFYETSEDHYRFESDFAFGELNFYDLEMYVTELRITDKKKDETAFFLHFELNDLDYAKELYDEFSESYKLLGAKRKVNVLLSCTSAITTSYMAGKLNEAAKLLSLDYHFDATPFPTIHEKAYDYDMVLLAPQVAQETKQLKAQLGKIPVLNIKPRHFATYDAPAILDTVRHEWQQHIDRKKPALKVKSLPDVNNNANILTLTLYPQRESRFAVKYRLFNNGKIIFDETVIKNQFDMKRDLCDILDTAVYRFEKYDIIGISTSGIIKDGRIDLPERIDVGFDLKTFLEDRYGVPVVIKNNANTAAYGYYAKNKSKYSNVAFLSQPFGYRFGGVGYVINDNPYEGSHGIAGEVKFTLMHRFGEMDGKNFSLLPGEALQTLEKYVRSIIALNDPDVIIIRCKILPDTDILKMKLSSYIPQEYIPKLIKVSDEDSTEYMLLGMMLFCVKALESEN